MFSKFLFCVKSIEKYFGYFCYFRKCYLVYLCSRKLVPLCVATLWRQAWLQLLTMNGGRRPHWRREVEEQLVNYQKSVKIHPNIYFQIS